MWDFYCGGGSCSLIKEYDDDDDSPAGNYTHLVQLKPCKQFVYRAFVDNIQELQLLWCWLWQKIARFSTG